MPSGFEFLGRRISDHEEAGDWPDGVGPASGSCVLIDGLGSSSRKAPWIQKARGLLRRPLSGFSYSGLGSHYNGLQTDILVQEDSAEIFEPYAAIGINSLTYLSFSLGGPVSLAGMFLGAPSSASNSLLILVQPAFVIHKEALNFYKRETSGRQRQLPVPKVVARSRLQKPTERDADADDLCQAATQLIARGAVIVVLYWDGYRGGDGFLAYPAALMRNLINAGVICGRLPISADSLRNDPVLRHFEIRDRPETIRIIDALLGAAP